MATHSSVLAWRISGSVVHGVAKSQTQLSNFHFHFTSHRLDGIESNVGRELWEVIWVDVLLNNCFGLHVKPSNFSNQVYHWPSEIGNRG